MTADAPFALLVIGPALMGLGQGVMSTPLLVGAQTAVGYRKRGVVTSLHPRPGAGQIPGSDPGRGEGWSP